MPPVITVDPRTQPIVRCNIGPVFVTDISGSTNLVSEIIGDANLVTAIEGTIELVSSIVGDANLVDQIVGDAQLVSVIEGSVELCTAITEVDMASGFIYVADILPTSGDDTVTNKVYQDTNDTVIQSATVSNLSVDLLIRASYPIVDIGGIDFTLTQAAVGIYEDTVTVTLVTGDNVLTLQTPDDDDGAVDTINITLSPPPQLLTLSFTGDYPLGPTAVQQTELKVGDSFQITGTTDKSADAIDILDFEAFDASSEVFAAGTSFTVTGTVADRGTTQQALAARVRARDSVTAAFGSTRDTDTLGGTTDKVDLVFLNNLFPSNAFGTITYPGTQQALKGSESATVVHTAANFDTMAYSSPGSELNVTNPTTFENPKTVTRAGGTYNIATDNLQAIATRNANGAQTTDTEVIQIAAVLPTIVVTEPVVRLVTGGNDGTSAQDHVITITSDQQLISAPSLDPAVSAGTFQGAGFTSGPTVWTRSLQVTDSENPGDNTLNTWINLVTTNLAEMVQSTIDTSGGNDDTYIIGGFVARNGTFAAFSDQVQFNVPVSTFANVTAALFTATNGTPIKQVIGTTADIVDGYTIDAIATDPVTFIWLDDSAVATNSTGTAQVQGFEETA